VLQVRAHRLSVRGVLQDAFELRHNARTIRVEHVLQPVERLDDPHGGPACPIQSTWRGSLKTDLLTTKCDRAQPRIRQDRDPRGDGRGQAQIIGGREAVDDDARLISPRDRVDDRGMARHGRLLGQGTMAREIVEAPIEPADDLIGG
jgi:hypothetical protein